MSSGERRAARLQRRQVVAAVTAGALVLCALIFVFFIQGRIGRSSYKIDGVFSSVSGLSPGSPVRIGGVDVGEVTGIRRGPRDSAVVTMTIADRGRPVHADARLAIRPRLALEGSSYVSLEPGTPSAPELPGGAVVPKVRTSVNVGLDQFLDTFDEPTRQALHDTFRGFAVALGPPRRGEPGPRGSTSMRAMVRSLQRALPSMSRAAQAWRGTQKGDLPSMLRSSGDFFNEMSADPAALSGLVEHFNRLAGDLASQDRQLAATVIAIDGVVRDAPRSLHAVDAALPSLQRFGRTAYPLLKAAPRPMRRTAELLRQVQALSGPRELQALLRRTKTFMPASAQLTAELKPLSEQLLPMNRCLSERAIPVLDQEVPDGALSTGDPAWLDLLHFSTNTTSVSGGFDGNGAAFRFGTSGSVSELEAVLPQLGAVRGIGPNIKGVRPAWLGFNVEPPYRPDEWCYRQPLARLDIPGSPPPPWAQGNHR